MPTSARQNRVEPPRRRASWPSAESKMSETIRVTNTTNFVRRSWSATRSPTTSPITSDHSVTWSAEIPVGWSARAIRIPMGRKKCKSAHSSTAWPLCDKSFCGFTEHILHDGEGAHRLILVDHQGWIDANLGVVDHREYAAGEQRVEDPARGLLVEQLAGPGNDQVHPDHEAAAPHVRYDRQLGFPALHLRQHFVAEPAGVLYQPVLDDRFDRGARGRRRPRIAAVGRRAAAGVGPRLRKRDLLARNHAAHGEAPAESLPDREHVGEHALMLDREHLSGAPESGDHLVADQQRAH